MLSILPFVPSGRAPAASGSTADAAAGRAALEADVRASLQAAQAERRAAALSRGERQAMVPERPAGPPGEGPVPRPAEAPVPRPVEGSVPPPVEAPIPARGTYRVLEIDGDVMYIEVQTAEGGTVRILTNTCMEGDTLILRQLHVEEGIVGSIGPRELRATLEAFVNEIGSEFGARIVRVEGGIRNSGTINPRTPRVREYEVE